MQRCLMSSSGLGSPKSPLQYADVVLVAEISLRKFSDQLIIWKMVIVPAMPESVAQSKVVHRSGNVSHRPNQQRKDEKAQGVQWIG